MGNGCSVTVRLGRFLVSFADLSLGIVAVARLLRVVGSGVNGLASDSVDLDKPLPVGESSNGCDWGDVVAGVSPPSVE